MTKKRSFFLYGALSIALFFVVLFVFKISTHTPHKETPQEIPEKMPKEDGNEEIINPWVSDPPTVNAIPGTAAQISAVFDGSYLVDISAFDFDVNGKGLGEIKVNLDESDINDIVLKTEVEIPSDSTEDVTGRIQLIYDGEDYGIPLTYTIKIVEPSSLVIPDDMPSFEGADVDYGVDPRGVVKNTIRFRVSYDFENPDEIARKIAALHGGVFIGANSEVNNYVIRIDDDIIETTLLENIISEISEMKETGFVGYIIYDHGPIGL